MALWAWAYGDSLVKGGRGVDLVEILHTIFFLLALPEFPPLFCPNLGGQLPPPAPLPRTPMVMGLNTSGDFVNELGNIFLARRNPPATVVGGGASAPTAPPPPPAYAPASIRPISY